jgi:hypothetical protein
MIPCRWLNSSILTVIDKLIRAAIGNGSIGITEPVEGLSDHLRVKFMTLGSKFSFILTIESHRDM